MVGGVMDGVIWYDWPVVGSSALTSDLDSTSRPRQACAHDEGIGCMIKDQQVAHAVSGIRQRSERQEEITKILGAFVDVGILPQLTNENNQILYGRRGTGKTH